MRRQLRISLNNELFLNLTVKKEQIVETDQVKQIILFGGGSSLDVCAKEAVNRKYDVVVITDKHHLSRRINSFGTLRQNLEKENIFYVETSSLSNELLEKYVHENTIGLSILTFWLFSEDIIKLFKGKLFNYHGARLPAERGGGTYTWKILSQSKIGGLTIHQVGKGIDTGDIYLYQEFVFPDSCIIPQDYMDFVEEIENPLLISFLDAIDNGMTLKPIPQMDHYSLYWPLLYTPLNGLIDWSWSSDDIGLFIHAFDDPYQGASTFYGDQKVYLKKCTKINSEGFFHPFQTGIVFRKNEGKLYIATQKGCLIVGEVFDESGENISGKIKTGHRFFTPYVELEKARRFKAQYGTGGLKNENQ